MAEPRGAGRTLLSVAAIAATLGGWFAIALRDAPTAAAPELTAPTLLSPIPTLEPAREAPFTPARRPVPVATTRSSR